MDAVLERVMGKGMTWKGHSARVEYDDEDGIFFGRLAGIRDGVSFHADTVEGLRAAFREAMAGYVDVCEDREGWVGCAFMAHRGAGSGAP